MSLKVLAKKEENSNKTKIVYQIISKTI